MRTRRGSSFYRSELARVIDQFAPGDYVLSTFMVIGDSLQGLVTDVNKKENKVYVAWNGGAVKQHDPDELMLSVKHVDIAPAMGEAMKQTVEDNPTPGDGTPVATAESEAESVTLYDNKALPGPQFIARRASLKTATNPPEEKFVGDKALHGLNEPVSGSTGVMRDLAYALKEESVKAVRKASAGEGRRMRTAVYFKERGRVYKRTRRERADEVMNCPRCRPDLVEMEKQPFTRGVGLWVCPNCGWKITTDKVIDEPAATALVERKRLATEILKLAKKLINV